MGKSITPVKTKIKTQGKRFAEEIVLENTPMTSMDSGGMQSLQKVQVEPISRLTETQVFFTH